MGEGGPRGLSTLPLVQTDQMPIRAKSLCHCLFSGQYAWKKNGQSSRQSKALNVFLFVSLLTTSGQHRVCNSWKMVKGKYVVNNSVVNKNLWYWIKAIGVELLHEWIVQRKQANERCYDLNAKLVGANFTPAKQFNWWVYNLHSWAEHKKIWRKLLHNKDC